LPLPAGKLAYKVAAVLLLATLGALVVITVMRSGPHNGLAQAPKENDKEKNLNAPLPLFQGWREKPDLVFVLSAQAHGYLQPCGCSSPQYGGLARRHQFIQSLRDKGWPVLPLDLGDMSQNSGAQATLKYKTYMKALDLMGYKAVGLGKNELLMPLTDALINYSANHANPRPVSANLEGTDPGKLFHQLNVRPSEIVDAGTFRVGIFGVASPSTIKTVAEALPGGDVKFVDNREAIPKVLEDMAKNKVGIGIMLYNGTMKEASACAEYAYKLHKENRGWPLLHAVLCLDDADNPPTFPQRINGIPTQIITLGHKARYVGVLGLFRNERSLEVRYQLVQVGPEYEPTDEQHAKNPVSQLMEEYAREVERSNFLAKVQRSLHPTQVALKEAKYVGSERCGKCHKEAYQTWAKSGHAHAFTTLADAKHPSRRHFDTECVSCHTVGFQHPSGWLDPPAQSDPEDVVKHNKKLSNVGCESCHGPDPKRT
jgi:hypothetical protein